MKTVKKLPILLAFAVALLVSACSDIDVNPRGTGDDEDPPIIIKPKPAAAVQSDTVSIAGID
jgi:hypothetical protein